MVGCFGFGAWWRRGRRYRQGRTLSLMYLEPFVGGRLFERIETDGGEVVAETGRVLVWSPPSKLVLEWRATNFQCDERTEVEVEFVDVKDSRFDFVEKKYVAGPSISWQPDKHMHLLWTPLFGIAQEKTDDGDESTVIWQNWIVVGWNY